MYDMRNDCASQALYSIAVEPPSHSTRMRQHCDQCRDLAGSCGKLSCTDGLSIARVYSYDIGQVPPRTREGGQDPTALRRAVGHVWTSHPVELHV